jgi:uncharacterized protein (TIGR02271 family)
MIHREEFLKKHPNIKGSMIAYDENGEKLGKITTLFEDGFNIEKGLFFPRDYSASYDDVLEVHDAEMIINLHRGRAGEKAREPLAERAAEPGAKASLWSGRIDDLNRGGEIEVPLMEEELRVEKTEAQKSEVHLRKFVHTEDKTMTIPVKSEELVVEHARPSGVTEAASYGDTAFTEEDITIPLMEERVEVLKSQHVRETVHLKKEPHMENQEVKGTVRIEDVKVETKDKGAVKEKRNF